MKKFIPFYDLCLNPITMWKDSRRDLTREQLRANREQRIIRENAKKTI